VLELDDAGARRAERVTAGRVFVDGKGIGDVRTSSCAIAATSPRTARARLARHPPAIGRESWRARTLVSRGVWRGANRRCGGRPRRVMEALAALNPESRTDPAEVKEGSGRALRRTSSASSAGRDRPRRDGDVVLTWWQAVVLGLVEGITGVPPVSSTGHLILTSSLLRLDRRTRRMRSTPTWSFVQAVPILACSGSIGRASSRWCAAPRTRRRRHAARLERGACLRPAALGACC